MFADVVRWTHATPCGYQKLRVKWHRNTYSVKGASELFYTLLIKIILLIILISKYLLIYY